MINVTNVLTIVGTEIQIKEILEVATRVMWGTDINGSKSITQLSPSSVQLKFISPWDVPNYIFIQLSKIYPTAQITLEYADGNSDCGIIKYANGVEEEIYSGDNDTAALVFSYRVRGDVKDVLKDYVTENIIEEDVESDFGNAAMVRELIEHFLLVDNKTLIEFIEEGGLRDTILNVIQKLAIKNEVYEIASVVKNKKEQVSLL